MAGRDTLFLDRYLTGLRSLSVVHLGTYFGNLKYSLKTQELHPKENFLCVADLHALTGPGGVMSVRRENYDLLRKFLALGFNPSRTIFYRQSDIAELFECMWLLACFANLSDFTALPDFVDRHDKGVASALYPLLMAADILGIRASHVSVGPDEEAHVGYAGRIARGLSSSGELEFPIPIRNPDVRDTIPGLDGERMARRLNNWIGVFESEEEVRWKIDHIPLQKPRNPPIDPKADIAFRLFSVLALPGEVERLSELCRINQAGSYEAVERIFPEFQRNFGAARMRYEKLQRELSDDDCEQIFVDGRRRVRGEFQVTMSQIRELHPRLK